MNTKILRLVIIGLLICVSSFSQSTETLELPFFDDFEETISNDATFQNWTTENLEGWHYWHMVTYQGVNGSQCMRFENTDIVQNDWIISNPINCAGAENLKVNFSHFYHTNKVLPKLYYTNQYNGNASQSTWTELSYSFGDNENQWYSSEDFIIENPSDVIYFAFHYQAAANEGTYFLLDNFSVKEYIPITPFNLVGTSEHFEFYTNISGEENFYQEIESALEAKYLNYVSLWQRPYFESIFKTDSKIKVKYCSRNDVLSLGKEMADWDCGSFDFSNNTIFISPLTSEIQQNYYTDLSSLSVNELSQLALAGKLYNDGDVNYQVWYLEGFGLYEMGYRPNRNDLISKLNGLGTNEPGIESVTDLQLLNETGNKDLMASLFESKVLVGCYFYLSTWHNSYDWHMLLKHYYIQEGSERIRLIYSTENFDFYGNENEIPSIADLANDMETQFALQESRFDIQINHRINICIYEVPVGLEMTNRTDFQGVGNGADLIEVTPHRESGIYGLIHHEFMHMMVNILSNHNPGPGQFLNEGLASFTDGPMPEEHKPAHRYKIQDLFYHYQRKYNREPTWLEIVDNTEVNEEDGFWVDAYALGFMYWSYMYEKYPDGFWVKVKLFMQSGRDWTVFGGKTTEQEGAEFIQFMKELAFVGPPLETTPLPFNEDFETGFDGWTLMRYGVNDLWKNEENAGINESNCAYVVDPYWLEDKNVDSWLVSPPLDCTGETNINVRFNYKQHGQGIKPEIYYAGNFTGTVDPVDWILVEGISWDAPEGEWSEISFNIENAPNKLNIGVRYLSNDGNYTTYLIDDFSVKSNSASQLDDDGDGVMNDVDTCPDTPTEEDVDANGCSDSQIDDDSDGIMNNIDTCPNTPSGEEVNATGCSQSQVDDDSDGVMNNADLCLNTPTGEEVNATGCSQSQIDDDSDGVMNTIDTCPETPTGEEVNTTGCSQSQIDDDGDGVMNNLDTCSNTPNGEEVNTTGCSESQKDDDEDGVMNNLDLCPNTTEGSTVNNQGCFTLPSNNFSIEVISETCPDKNNGELTITANETHSYTATINNANYNFTNNSLTVSNLDPGTYTVCISVTGETFEQCYTIVIAEGKTVSGKASVASNKASISIEQGTAPYNVYVNGISVLNTLASSFTIDVKHGDLLEVKTAKYCEGVFLKAIDLFENITVYPNPSKGIFEITLPISEKEVVIELYTMGSQLISKGTYQVVNGKVQINLENRPTGVYVVKIYLDTPVSLTIIKE